MVVVIEIGAVIFDLDGTLLNTEPLSAHSIQQVLTRLGCQISMTWEIQKRLLGLKGSDWSRIVIDEFGLNEEINTDTFVKEWEYNLSLLCSEVEKMKGAEILTLALHTKGIKMAIATSSNRLAVEVKRKRHEAMFARMSYIICGDDEGVENGKPAPDIYLLAASKLNIEPSKCLAFEDALNGVKSARNAGMYVCCVPDIRLDLSPFLAESPYILADSSLENFDWALWNFISSA